MKVEQTVLLAADIIELALKFLSTGAALLRVVHRTSLDCRTYHLMLGPAPNKEIVLAPAEVLRRIGWAIADQLKDDEETIRSEAEGPRSLILGLDDDGHQCFDLLFQSFRRNGQG